MHYLLFFLMQGNYIETIFYIRKKKEGRVVDPVIDTPDANEWELKPITQEYYHTIFNLCFVRILTFVMFVYIL